MQNKRVVGLLAALLVAGCAIHDGRPPVSTMDVGGQVKLKSASHWQIVAADVSSQIARAFKQDNLTPRQVWVPDGSSKSRFAAVFASQLRSSLVQSGLVVADSPKTAYEVEVKTEAVWHGKSRHAYRPGTYTALATGVMVLRDAIINGSDPVGAVIGVAAAYDVAKTIDEFSGRPFTELVLTTAIRHNGNYVLHRTDVYYVDEVDVALFETGARDFAVVGTKQ